MSDFCIISEFNPMHDGHKYIVDKARELGADSVSVVMSGNATQRGELAIADKYARGKAAVSSGVDLALELPYPWCAASADYFASAGVYIASQIADTLLFGSECGDIELLSGAAEYCESEAFLTAFEEKKKIMGAAKAFIECLAEAGFGVLQSNDLLGVAYVRAARRMSLNIKFRTVKRLGAAYSETRLCEGEFPSATAIRESLKKDIPDSVASCVPGATLDMLNSALAGGELTSAQSFWDGALWFFRLSDPERFCDIAEAGGGLANRICAAACESCDGSEMFEKIRTKRYTDARVRRAMMFCMTDVRAGLLDTLPEYTTLLGANDKGREILASLRRAEGLPVVTKPADAPRECEQYRVSAKLDLLFGLSRDKRTTAAEMIRKNAYIEIKEKT